MNMKTPNFFIVGAPKCGTTVLHRYLNTHPDIYFAPVAKEPHHYNSDMPGFQWHPSVQSYLRLYDTPEAAVARYRGDASVQYLYSEVAAQGIANDVPDAKILICVRHPVSFIRSYHNQSLVNADEDITDLEDCWNRSGQVRSVAREPKMLDYKSVGLFAQQIARYRAHFPDAQIRIIRQEELSANPEAHYRALLNWLELPDDGRTEFGRVHGAISIRNQKLAANLKNPPNWVRSITRSLKRVLRVDSLGIAKKLKKANSAQGYRTQPIGPDLAAKIEAHYAADQAALRAFSSLFLLPRDELNEE